MISGSFDKTARQWDLNAGKEIEEVRDVYEKEVLAVTVSRDGRWIVSGGGDWSGAELKACEVETEIVKTFEGHLNLITCIDISVDNTLLASEANDSTARIWNLETGKLVAGPFKSIGFMGAIQFSPNSEKLAVKSIVGKYLEVWDIRSQKLDVKIGQVSGGRITYAPLIWTNNRCIQLHHRWRQDNL
jgi:WD40 repeat protein